MPCVRVESLLGEQCRDTGDFHRGAQRDHAGDHHRICVHRSRDSPSRRGRIRHHHGHRAGEESSAAGATSSACEHHHTEHDRNRGCGPVAATSACPRTAPSSEPGVLCEHPPAVRACRRSKHIPFFQARRRKFLDDESCAPETDDNTPSVRKNPHHRCCDRRIRRGPITTCTSSPLRVTRPDFSPYLAMAFSAEPRLFLDRLQFSGEARTQQHVARGQWGIPRRDAHAIAQPATTRSSPRCVLAQNSDSALPIQGEFSLTSSSV